MKRNISSFGLLCTSISAILGSGWLFGSFFAAKYAGPASLIAWVIGGAMVCVLAFTFAEVCALIPVSGSTVRIPHFTHGRAVSIVFSLVVWISYVALMVIEVEAVVEYLSYFYPWMFHGSDGLTTDGYLIACIIMLIIAIINNYSVKWLIRFNTLLTIIKIVVPISIALILLFLFFNVSQIIHPSNSSFAPFGFHGIFMAISAGGIIFSFNAFKQAADLAGEAKNPRFAVPFAIVGSIFICLIIFILLQAGFIVALTPANLAAGWHSLQLSSNSSPFVSIITQSKILWLLPILFFTAVISPFAAGLMYSLGGSRALFGMAENGSAPKGLRKLTRKGIPLFTIWVNFALGLIIFQFFTGWNTLATFLTCLFATGYLAAPICLVSLRRQVPDLKRPIKLPFGNIWSFFAFYFCTLFIYWTGWNTISKVAVFFIVCLLIVIILQILTKIKKIPDNFNWKSSIWLWIYFIGIVIFSYTGNYGGGHELIHETPLYILMAIFCVIILIISTKFALPAERTLRYMMEETEIKMELK
jgi:amino acid transporter